tara:strand:- start:17 stop:268 length:252 start_codon:yes stop_codon:yes gene_type:complete
MEDQAQYQSEKTSTKPVKKSGSFKNKILIFSILLNIILGLGLYYFYTIKAKKDAQIEQLKTDVAKAQGALEEVKRQLEDARDY